MNRTQILNSPFLLGFDHLERLLERSTKNGGESYPPYNIEQGADGRLKITVAVAGFRREDLSVTTEGNQLFIRGKQSEPTDKSFLHQGIANRQFQRSFVLAEGIQIQGAVLENGLLTIDLIRPMTDDAVRTIEIRSPQGDGVAALRKGGQQ